MTTRLEIFAAKIDAKLSEPNRGQLVRRQSSTCGELTYEVDTDHLVSVCLALRDDADLKVEQLIDVTGVDYLQYGRTEWSTESSTSTGFSRGVHSDAENSSGVSSTSTVPGGHKQRFAVVYHLMSIANNVRVRLRCYCSNQEPPMIPSVVDVWASANWFEREAFDMYGILFSDHPDLRRILTDYGFIGHPFRKDFPLSGNVEVRYDPVQARVVYQPVSIEPRILVPRVIRDDNRYDPALTSPASVPTK